MSMVVICFKQRNGDVSDKSIVFIIIIQNQSTVQQKQQMKGCQPLQKMTFYKENQRVFGYTSPNSNYINKINNILQNDVTHGNTYTHKGHPKRQEPKSRIKTDTQTSFDSPIPNIIPNREKSKVKMTHLLNQNIFLLNELMIQKQKEQDYLHTIKKLQKSRSEQQISFIRTNSKYIKIQERPFSPDSRKFICNRPKHTNKFNFSTAETDLSLKMHDQQESFIKFSRKRISQQIQQLTDELFHLIQQSQIQGSSTTHKQHNSEMFECLKSLQLRKKYVSQHCI